MIPDSIPDVSMIVLVVDGLNDEGAVYLCFGHLLEEGSGGGCVEKGWGGSLVWGVGVGGAFCRG